MKIAGDPIAYRMPNIDSLNLGKIGLYYDVDLDHLTLLFSESDHFLSHREIDAHKDMLMDPAAQVVAGVEYTAFMRAVVPQNPRLLDAMPFATVISGDMQVAAIQTKQPAERQRLRDQERSIIRYLVEWQADQAGNGEATGTGAFRQLTA